MKLKLLRYNNDPIEFNIQDIDRIVGLSQCNLMIVLKNHKTYQGHTITLV